VNGKLSNKLFTIKALIPFKIKVIHRFRILISFPIAIHRPMDGAAGLPSPTLLFSSRNFANQSPTLLAKLRDLRSPISPLETSRSPISYSPRETLRINLRLSSRNFAISYSKTPLPYYIPDRVSSSAICIFLTQISILFFQVYKNPHSTFYSAWNSKF
jgi:hypothetical protein